MILNGNRATSRTLKQVGHPNLSSGVLDEGHLNGKPRSPYILHHPHSFLPSLPFRYSTSLSRSTSSSVRCSRSFTFTHPFSSSDDPNSTIHGMPALLANSSCRCMLGAAASTNSALTPCCHSSEASSMRVGSRAGPMLATRTSVSVERMGWEGRRSGEGGGGKEDGRERGRERGREGGR